MARLNNPTTSQPMGRSRLSSPSKDTVNDNGTVLVSVVDGEQIQMQLTVGWMTNLSSANIVAKIVEGSNLGDGELPEGTATNPIVKTLVILDQDATDNVFKIVIPEDLTSTWSQKATPNKPVYGFIGLEIDDGGIGSAKQIWKPLRGLVEVLYSPSEA